ncbi:MAG: transketolase, partial [Acutalibacteraceae bacterium]
MDEQRKKELKKFALKVKKHVIVGTNRAKSGHPGGSLSCAEILTYLYFEKMNIDPKNPQMENRDRFVLSKGHAAPALYGTLALRGFFPESEIELLRKPNALLQG